MTNKKLELIYEQFKQLNLKEIAIALDTVKDEEEKEFFLALYNYKLGSQQKKVINRNEFIR